MKKYTKEEVEKARAFLAEDGRKPTWFRFDNVLAGQLKPLLTPEETIDQNGKTVFRISDPIVPATVLCGLIEYFEKGEIPEFVKKSCSENPNKIVAHMLDGILQQGCELIDAAYVEYSIKIQAGSRGGIARAENFLKQLDDAFSDDQTGDILPAQE